MLIIFKYECDINILIPVWQLQIIMEFAELWSLTIHSLLNSVYEILLLILILKIIY